MTTKTTLAILGAAILAFANVDGIRDLRELNEFVEAVVKGGITEVEAHGRVSEEAQRTEAFELLLNRKKSGIILEKELSPIQLEWIREDIPKIFSLVKSDIPDEVVAALQANTSIVKFAIFGSEGALKMKQILGTRPIEDFTVGYMSVDEAVGLLEEIAKHADSVTTISLLMITGKDLEGKDLSQLGGILSLFTCLKSLSIKSNTPLPVSVLEVLRKMPLLEEIQVNSTGEEIVRNLSASVKKVILYRRATEEDNQAMFKAGFRAEHPRLFIRE